MALSKEQIDKKALAVLEAASALVKSGEAPFRVDPTGAVAALKVRNLGTSEVVMLVVSDKPYAIQLAEVNFDSWVEQAFAN